MYSIGRYVGSRAETLVCRTHDTIGTSSTEFDDSSAAVHKSKTTTIFL